MSYSRTPRHGYQIRLFEDHDVEDVDEVQPFDSISNEGSSSTTRSSIMAELRAKTAALEAEANVMAEVHEIEKQQAALDRKRKETELRAKITSASVMENVMSEMLSKEGLGQVGSCRNSVQSTPEEVRPASRRQLSPSAGVFVPQQGACASKWCSRCGMGLQAKAKFCSQCGAEQDCTTPAKVTKDMIDFMDMPRVELPNFSGDPVRYHEFMLAFEEAVGRRSWSPAKKLNQLIHCVDGSVKEALRPYLFDPAEGYNKAMLCLKERYGDVYRVSQAHIQKLLEGPQIKHNEVQKLRMYSDKVKSCVLTLKSLGRLTDADARDIMVTMTSKLPAYAQTRWKRRVYEIKRKYACYPSSEDFSEFLEEIAEEANDPYFAEVVPQRKPNEENNESRNQKHERGSAFNVTTHAQPWSKDNGKQFSCFQCSSTQHRLRACSTFASLPADQRLSNIQKWRICYRCLSGRHRASECKSSETCQNCGQQHSVLLHDSLYSAKTSQTKEGSSDVSGVVTLCGEGSGDAGLPVVPLKIRGADGWIKTFALLDPGSNRTLCSQSLFDRVNLTGEDKVLDLKVVGSAREVSSKMFTAKVCPMKGKHQVTLTEVFAVDCFPKIVPSQPDLKRWPHLCDLQLPKTGPVELLIGNNVAQVFRHLDERIGAAEEPIAVKTIFGWIVHGDCGSNSSNYCCFVQMNASNAELVKSVERFWKVDGVPEMSEHPLEDRAVLKMWEKEKVMIGDHIQLPIPFKSTPPPLHDNRNAALRRLYGLEKRFSKDPDLAMKYATSIGDLLQKGHAEQVSELEEPAFRWYLPHHNVINKRKPDKFRIVFDCSAVDRRTSLNKQVYAGPDLTNNLLGVLLRFRLGSVAVMGDIEGMFLQVKVPPEHRDALRFLFRDGGRPDAAIKEYRLTSHLFGGTWSPSAASFALKDSLHRGGVDQWYQSFYVDDCLCSFQNAHEAKHFITTMTKVLADSGFRITKWVSNSVDVLQDVPDADRAKSISDLSFDHLPQERALGVVWNTQIDTLSVQTTSKEEPYTKRGVLKVLSSVYDPLGLVSPFVLKAKLIFQFECCQGKDWDDPLSSESQTCWRKWMEDLPRLRGFQISRGLCVGVETETAQLHYFCDASEAAYGAVVYVRVGTEEVQTRFVMAKSRLAPMKHHSIPRLELCAAVLAIQLHVIVSRELKIPDVQIFFWSDSQVVLRYIRNRSRRFHTFVANRVGFIQEHSEVGQWFYVPTRMNPADCVSRGLSASELSQDVAYSRGPEFLRLNGNASWPDQPLFEEVLDDVEVKKSEVVCCLVETGQSVGKACCERLIGHYSCFFRLKEAICWLRRFARWLGNKCESQQKCLSVAELHSAETALICYVQRSSYSEEFRALKSSGVVSKQSRIAKLDPVMNEDGLLVVRGRIGKAVVSIEYKQPKILPRDHHLSFLIVQHTHQSAAHAGRETTFASLRQMFWVVGGRSVVRKVVGACLLCKRLRGSLMSQQMSNLPADRVSADHPPFHTVGVDCFGPYLVKRGRSSEKRYGCIFVCSASRGVHIEVLHSMEADSFMNALLRFAARRTFPARIRSDNGTNFVACRKKLAKELLIHKVEWEFNPPSAPHMGGMWERIIGSVKRNLDAIAGNKMLDDERLMTFFCQVETLLNNRPLTSVSDDPSSLQALRPMDLLQPFAQSVRCKELDDRDQYRRRWQHVQVLVKHFWRRWRDEYLHTLLLKRKWLREKRNCCVGDLVMVSDEVHPRNEWPLGRVTQVHPGDDGLVRMATVKTKLGEFKRPIHKLCLLEGSEI